MIMASETLTAESLKQFRGTEHYYRHPLYRNLLFTDGVKYATEEGGANWLLDDIAAVERNAQAVRDQPFKIWQLKRQGEHGALLTCGDREGKTLYTQKYHYADFPLDKIEFWVGPGEGTDKIIYLPSEH
jgi:hypothetical protein